MFHNEDIHAAGLLQVAAFGGIVVLILIIESSDKHIGGAAVSHWPNKYVIGLTGNIAVGKSVVRQMLQHSGAYTIDADSLSHQVMLPGAPAYKPVIETFGQFIVGSDKKINRQLLGQMVFSNPTALQKLEAITHPIIRQAINVLVGRAKQPIVVIEAIKLLEGDLVNLVDAVWVVNAKPQTQYRRLVTKRKMTQDDAKQRILAQGSQAEKLKRADVVIENDGDIEKTWKQVQVNWKQIRVKLREQQQGGAAAQPTPAQPAATAQPVAPLDDPEETSETRVVTIDVSGIKVTRGTPNNAQLIADFKNEQGSGETQTRMDVMMSFGEKSYLVAQSDNDDVIGLLGWTVENLVTRMDDFFLKPGVPVDKAVHAIILAVEEASNDLQSEVGFIFLPMSTSDETLAAFQADDYALTTLKDIKVPVWREAVKEKLEHGEAHVLWKQLRQDRVLQPI